MKYAIVRIGGKQVKISEGQTFQIERQEKLHFDVLAYNDGKETIVGSPILKDVKLNAEIVENKLGKKVKVVRFKAKSRYKKNKGFRQPYSFVRVNSILKDGEIAEAKVAKVKVVKAPKVEKSAKKTVKKAVKAVKKETQ